MAKTRKASYASKGKKTESEHSNSNQQTAVPQKKVPKKAAAGKSKKIESEHPDSEDEVPLKKLPMKT